MLPGVHTTPFQLQHGPHLDYNFAETNTTHPHTSESDKRRRPFRVNY